MSNVDETAPIRIGLARAQAAAFIGISAPTFDRLVASGLTPKPKRIVTRLVWNRREIERAFSSLETTDEGHVIADKGYDADALRHTIRQCTTCFPSLL